MTKAKPRRKFSEKWWCAVALMPSGPPLPFCRTAALDRKSADENYRRRFGGRPKHIRIVRVNISGEA